MPSFTPRPAASADTMPPSQAVGQLDAVSDAIEAAAAAAPSSSSSASPPPLIQQTQESEEHPNKRRKVEVQTASACESSLASSSAAVQSAVDRDNSPADTESDSRNVNGKDMYSDAEKDKERCAATYVAQWIAEYERRLDEVLNLVKEADAEKTVRSCPTIREWIPALKQEKLKDTMSRARIFPRYAYCRLQEWEACKPVCIPALVSWIKTLVPFVVAAGSLLIPFFCSLSLCRTSSI